MCPLVGSDTCKYIDSVLMLKYFTSGPRLEDIVFLPLVLRSNNTHVSVVPYRKKLIVVGMNKEAH